MKNKKIYKAQEIKKLYRVSYKNLKQKPKD